MALDIILQHSNQQGTKEPLRMSIEGTTGTSKSYLINTIKKELYSQEVVDHNPLLLLSPTGVTSFNIHATTIHTGIRIPIKNMQPLHAQALSVLQEEMKHIQYILIDEMRFIGPKFFVQIDSRVLPRKK